ncbi:MAG: SBBP repeat-containing protein [Ignavibacteria bacterium]|nr:SBBP repeat-containing protein [Ignavibacteria bacterium]
MNVEWFRTYSAGRGKNFVNDFVIDALGNCYLTGNVSLNASNSRTAIGTVKYSSNGELLWSNSYEGNSQSYADGTALVVDKNENVYVTGICTDNDENYCTIKYNALGEILWVKKYHSGPGGRDEASDIALDNDDNIYVTGYTYYSGLSQYFWSTLKYDSSGNLLWI